MVNVMMQRPIENRLGCDLFHDNGDMRETVNRRRGSGEEDREGTEKGQRSA